MSINPKGDDTLESKQPGEITPDPAAPQDEKKSEELSLDGNESKKQVLPEVDYKSMLEAEKAKLQKAEEKIVKLKKSQKQVPKEEEEEVEEEVEEDRVAQIVKEQIVKIKDQVRSEIVQSEVEELLGEISSNPDEQALIKHIYENRLQRSGFTRSSIREDLINAKVLANRDTLLKSNKELSEALRSKSSLQTTANFSSGTRDVKKPEMQLSTEEKALLARYGVK